MLFLCPPPVRENEAGSVAADVAVAAVDGADWGQGGEIQREGEEGEASHLSFVSRFHVTPVFEDHS